MNRVRKVPLRKCVGCQEMKPKAELTRVVRTPEGDIVLDSTGKRNGRGAYLCRSEACLQIAVKRRALERALKAAIPQEIHESLRRQLVGDGDAH
ncbi:YlxR family protein [Alicyclobacillus mali]|uniref:YlxR family protein n=1 Tax=Alicyclobacillus mali (ex Roth et al. 2021) TaxID=1123961 RepID=A0ABS0F1N7_9BACL|nr:YlxR family protein [Alicyclobacillus mali (ex Roth et al. 2021)]MBF8377200.1 YlxR family protein [Alicyclobacillus mali (ex Roth et al. 2021)]MCL6488771.1 YlxR family protein [Alicyclobacillus mali (ex Roth et al. 2021)]